MPENQKLHRDKDANSVNVSFLCCPINSFLTMLIKKMWAAIKPLILTDNVI